MKKFFVQLLVLVGLLACCKNVAIADYVISVNNVSRSLKAIKLNSIDFVSFEQLIKLFNKNVHYNAVTNICRTENFSVNAKQGNFFVIFKMRIEDSGELKETILQLSSPAVLHNEILYVPVVSLFRGLKSAVDFNCDIVGNLIFVETNEDFLIFFGASNPKRTKFIVDKPKPKIEHQEPKNNYQQENTYQATKEQTLIDENIEQKTFSRAKVVENLKDISFTEETTLPEYEPQTTNRISTNRANTSSLEKINRLSFEDLKEAPVVENVAPVTIKETPVLVKENPVITKENSVTAKENPVLVKENPVITKENPVATKENPVATKENPVATKENPVTTKESSVLVKENSVTTKENPVTTKENPVLVKENSVATKENPVLVKEAPIVKKELPVVVKENTTSQKQNEIVGINAQQKNNTPQEENNQRFKMKISDLPANSSEKELNATIVHSNEINFDNSDKNFDKIVSFSASTNRNDMKTLTVIQKNNISDLQYDAIKYVYDFLFEENKLEKSNLDSNILLDNNLKKEDNLKIKDENIEVQGNETKYEINKFNTLNHSLPPYRKYSIPAMYKKKIEELNKDE